MKLTIPAGFARVSEITTIDSERQAIYDELKSHRLPCIKSGGGKHGTVHVSVDHARAFLRLRQERLAVEAKIRATPAQHHYGSIPVTEDASARLLAMSNLEASIDGLSETQGEMIAAQKETNRLLGELLKVWSPKA